MDEARRRGRQVLLIVAALFLIPLAVSFALYYGKLWRPAGSVSKGELIQPPRLLEMHGLRLPDGGDADPQLLTDKWSLIYIGDGACDEVCQAALVFGRQSRLALNNDMTRVQRIFLATAHCCATGYFAREQPGLIALDASSPEARALLAQFPGDRQHSLYLVDPLGNLMMRHDAMQPTSKDLLTDLKKLLRLSHIG
jgi:cytochrome oxidase Cu insertion factor (SCO1/SenC/PrrC family)